MVDKVLSSSLVLENGLTLSPLPVRSMTTIARWVIAYQASSFLFVTKRVFSKNLKSTGRNIRRTVGTPSIPYTGP